VAKKKYFGRRSNPVSPTITGINIEAREQTEAQNLYLQVSIIDICARYFVPPFIVKVAIVG
jgi:hypothetical protein